MSEPTECEVCGSITNDPVLTSDSHPIGPNEWVCSRCDDRCLDNVAYPGGYEVAFSRSIKHGKKAHSVQVRYGDAVVGSSGKTLSDTLRSMADKLDDELGGGPYASVVWGSKQGVPIDKRPSAETESIPRSVKDGE